MKILRSVFFLTIFLMVACSPEVGSEAWCENMKEKPKSGWVSDPKIGSYGPYLKTHTRHFLQRCQYTYCLSPDDQPFEYAPHEAVFQKNQADQDLLWKFTIPRSERTTVLRYLDRHNMTAFSLFATEDRLMETLAVRAFVLDRPGR
ncbi:MAG: DUF3012 domain-containing protein [Nitrospinae bacterium]|nr:DUF3012 domain-containing protein [Nitrospinota bacterium]